MSARIITTVCLSLLAHACSAADRPNILFVLTKDQGDHMSLLGTPGLQTPHMDSIAKSGVYFKNAFAAYPVCSASNAALYTGLHSHTNGILNNTHNYHKPADQVTAEEHERRLARTNRVRTDRPGDRSPPRIGTRRNDDRDLHERSRANVPARKDDTLRSWVARSVDGSSPHKTQPFRLTRSLWQRISRRDWESNAI